MSATRPIRSLLIFVAVVFIGGALIAPWVYHGVAPLQSAAGWHVSPFHRVFSRCLIGLALVCAWPLLRTLNIRSWRNVGFVSPMGQGRRLGAGLAFGFGSLLCLVLIVLAVQHWGIKVELSGQKLALNLAGAAATAIVVAVMEELLFRGIIFGALRKTLHWRLALVLSSLVYAILHFIGRTNSESPVIWSSGLEFLPVMFRDVANLDLFIPKFFSLVLVGLMLGLAYQRTGNLYFSIGLHAGWIFWLKAYGFFAPPVGTTRDWLWGSPVLIDGWMAFVVLLAALLVLPKFLPAKREERPT